MIESYMLEAREHSVIDERGASVDVRCLMFVSAGMNIFIKVEVAQICLAAGSYILNPHESLQFSFSLFRVTSRLAAESLLVKWWPWATSLIVLGFQKPGFFLSTSIQCLSVYKLSRTHKIFFILRAPTFAITTWNSQVTTFACPMGERWPVTADPTHLSSNLLPHLPAVQANHSPPMTFYSNICLEIWETLMCNCNTPPPQFFFLISCNLLINMGLLINISLWLPSQTGLTTISQRNALPQHRLAVIH